MDPVTMIIVPGFVGGLVIALLLTRLNRKSDAAPDSSRDQPPPTDVINMARIRVAGIGGLGFVAMAIVVALAIPRIGGTLAAGLMLGALFAIILIGWRRRTGPMPSSGRRPGANTVLSIDVTPPESPDDGQGSTAVPDDSPGRPASRGQRPGSCRVSIRQVRDFARRFAGGTSTRFLFRDATHNRLNNEPPRSHGHGRPQFPAAGLQVAVSPGGREIPSKLLGRASRPYPDVSR